MGFFCFHSELEIQLLQILCVDMFMNVAFLFWLATKVISSSLVQFATSRLFFFRHKAFGKSWLNIWIPENCLTFILRL